MIPLPPGKYRCRLSATCNWRGGVGPYPAFPETLPRRIAWACNAPIESAPAKMTLFVIAYHADPSGKAWPAVETLCPRNQPVAACGGLRAQAAGRGRMGDAGDETASDDALPAQVAGRSPLSRVLAGDPPADGQHGVPDAATSANQGCKSCTLGCKSCTLGCKRCTLSSNRRTNRRKL